MTVSTFHFNVDGGDDHGLSRHSETRGYKYRFGETLAEVALPLSLTCWSDSEVVIALPPLTCDPRIVKIQLPRLAEATPSSSSAGADTAFWTLGAPIYFPTSTPRRKAHLVYRSSQGTKGSEYLCLALDSVEGAPVVLRWKIGELGGWRAWDDEHDGTASDVTRAVTGWQLLKGDFVDNDKYFSVPIRSGLDWTRKGHLSCAAF